MLFTFQFGVAIYAGDLFSFNHIVLRNKKIKVTEKLCNTLLIEENLGHSRHFPADFLSVFFLWHPRLLKQDLTLSNENLKKEIHGT